MYKNKIIKMQYPNNKKGDGKIHRIEPKGLFEVNKDGNRFYLLEYKDIDLNQDMITVLEKTRNGYIKRPLIDYTKIGFLLPYAKPVSDNETIGDFIGLGSETTVEELTKPKVKKSRQVVIEVFERNDGFYVTREVASNIFGIDSKNPSVKIDIREINQLVKITKDKEISYVTKFINQKTLSSKQTLFEVYMRNNGLFVKPNVARKLFGKEYAGLQDVKVTQEEIREIEQESAYEEISYKARYVDQRQKLATATQNPNNPRQMRLAEFEVFVDERGMYVNNYVATNLFNLPANRTHYVTKEEIHEVENRVYLNDIKYKAKYVNAYKKANNVNNTNKEVGPTLRIYTFANGYYVERNQARLCAISPNNKQNYYYLTKQDLQSLCNKYNVNVEFVREIEKDEIYVTPSKNKLLIALENNTNTYINADGFMGLINDVYKSENKSTSDRINRIMLNTNGVVYTLYDKEELIPEFATTIINATNRIEDKNEVNDKIIGVLKVLKDAYATIKSNNRDNLKSYYNLLLIGLLQSVYKTNNKTKNNSEEETKGTPGSNGRR